MNEDMKTPVTEEEQKLQNPADEDAEFKKKKPDEEEEEKKEEKKPPFPPKKDEDDSDDKKDSEESEEDEDEDKKKKKKGHFAKESDEDEEKKCPDCGKPQSECECDKKKKYNLEEIPEYVELAKNYALLTAELDTLKTEIQPLRDFKAAADKKEKQAMIDGFYMLSDEDKKDVIDNIDNYSLNDIEAKLSIICVRNKVNFNLDDDKKDEPKGDPMVYSLNDNDNNGDSAPAWIKAVRDTAKTMI